MRNLPANRFTSLLIRGTIKTRGLEGSRYVSRILNRDGMVEEQQLYHQYFRPQAGHSGLSRKPLNAKELSCDRGNGISIEANRFGQSTEGLVLHPHFCSNFSPNCVDRTSPEPNTARRKQKNLMILQSSAKKSLLKLT